MTGHFCGKKALWLPLVILLAAAVAAFVFGGTAELVLSPVGTPTLFIKTPPKVPAQTAEEVVVEVGVSDLGDARYPAASASICFDSSHLEFLGVAEGNVMIHGETNAMGVAAQLPEWSCNVENSNRTGTINIMYLDITGGKYAFDRALLTAEEHVVFRLRFRVRGNAEAGDIYGLTVADAVFAASDESQSLSMTQGTLQTRDGRIVVGDRV